MEQKLLEIYDLSNISFKANYKNVDVLDLSRSNIYNINKSIFSETLSRFIKIDFDRKLIIKNIQLYGFSNNNINYRMYYKLDGIPIYDFYTDNNYYTSYNIADTSSVSCIVLETNNIVNLPNKIEYKAHITDDIFNVENDNINIKWSWQIDIPSTTYRYSSSITTGMYSISGLNAELNNMIFDLDYGPRTIFKIEYPLTIRDSSTNYPNFTLTFYNNSNFNVIIYSDSSLFTFLTITTPSFIVYKNSYYTIDFSYLPNSNEYLSVAFNNTTIYDEYNRIIYSNNFLDKLPKTDASGDDIDYAGSDIKEIDIERKTILDISDNTAIRVASTRDELNLGVYTILGELSSNNIETIYGTHTNTIASELSLNDIVSENIVYSTNIDTSFIETNNITVNNNVIGQNISFNTETFKITTASFEDLDFSNNEFNLNNSSNNFNINKNNYKLLLFEFKNPNQKNINFTNFKFTNKENTNPLFNSYLLDTSSNYFRVGTINNAEISYNDISNAVNIGDNKSDTLNLSIPYIQDLSKVIFEFEESQSRGLYFNYEPLDNDRIFKIDASNNCIYYQRNDPSFIDISAVIKYTIPPAEYNLYEINTLLTKKSDFPATLFLSPDENGALRSYWRIGGTTTILFNSDISNNFRIVDRYNNSVAPPDLSNITYLTLSGDTDLSNISHFNTIGDFLDVSMEVPLKTYERFDRYTYNENKLLLFVKNDNLDFSYSILNDPDLSNSFFNYFFGSDISFIIPSDISDANTKYFDSSNILNISSGTQWINERKDTFIDISHNDSSGNNGGNIFAALLTLKSELNNNLYFDLYYINDNNIRGLDSSGSLNQDNLFKVYTNLNLKNHYFLKETTEYIDNSNNRIYYGISYEDNILSVDSSNLIYLKLDKFILTEEINELNKYVSVHDKFYIKELSCNEISSNYIESSFNDFIFNNLSSENVNKTKNIKINYNGYSTFNNSDISNVELAYFYSNIAHSGNRMNITHSGTYDGWCIKMDHNKKNLNDTGYGNLEFTSKFFDSNTNNTWFNINTGIVLTNSAPSVLSDKNFIDSSNSIANVYNFESQYVNGDTEFSLFPGPNRHRSLTYYNIGSPPDFFKNSVNSNEAINASYFTKNDISYGSVMLDVIMKLFPIKYKNTNTSTMETGYNLYDISDNVSKIKYILKDGHLKGASFSSLTPYICAAIQEISGALSKLESDYHI